MIQSTALSYARYKFYLSIGIEVTMDNYYRLFIDDKRFKKAYGYKKNELLKMYDYKEYVKIKKGEV